MTDEGLLDSALARLSATGAIEYRGEYGAELTTFIPFVCWLHSEGHLAGRRVISHAGMRPYYYFLDDDQFVEKPGKRAWLPPAERDWPSNSSYTATRQSWHRMPDYRARYRDEGPKFERPVLFIQNKFCVEWNAGPINYLPLNVLRDVFKLAGDRFDIVYSRPRGIDGLAGYSVDENADCHYPDIALARQFPAVLLLEEHSLATDVPYNLAKLRILSQSHLFIAVQGGGAHCLACFSNALMLLLHREGPEHPHAYAAGPYKYLASPAPLLMVAHTTEQLVSGAALIANVEVGDGRIAIAPDWLPVLNALRV